MIVERTELDESGAARGTGETYEVPASLVVTASAIRPRRSPDVPFEGGKFVNDEGRIADRLYAVGWARRGPSGTIGTNRPDGYEVADQIAAAMPPGSAGDRPGAAGLKRLLESRGVMPTDYDDWRRIEETEIGQRPPRQPAREVRPASRIGCRRSAAERGLRLSRTPFYLAAALAPAATVVARKRVPVGE